jgi:hypothetical protein
MKIHEGATVYPPLYKNCNCEGTSSTGAIRVKTAGLVTTFTFYSRLSCDVCGEPWMHKDDLSNLKDG